MKNITTFFLAIMIFFSSCASFLNSKNQRVKIFTSNENTVLIDGEEPKIKNGNYLLRRNMKAKQITVQKEGYKDENSVLMQRKKSPITFFSFIPFGILLYPMIMDIGPKSFNYDKEVRVGENLLKLPIKDKDSKDILIKKISLDFDKEDFTYRSFSSYNKYLKSEDIKEAEGSNLAENLSFDNTIFTGILNDILVECGYIDTTRKVLKGSFTNNIYLQATIEDIAAHFIGNRRHYSGGAIYVDLTVKWEALDYYQNTISTIESTSKSGMFKLDYLDDRTEIIIETMKDAMEESLIKFLSLDDIQEILHDNNTVEREENFARIAIPKSNLYVENLSEVVKASVTIKSGLGHGSGFSISNNGYIITNYHVVSGSEDLKVLTSDDRELDAEIVRVSKIHDLALLKVKADGLPALKISGNPDIKIASDIYAVGTPTSQDLAQTISRGIISGIRDSGYNSKLIQTDASVNAGNSGGAIVNNEGKVVGVVSSKLSGFGIEGVAFGIPAYEIIERLKLDIN